MEQYIESYKHLIGYEYVVRGESYYVGDVHIDVHWVEQKPTLSGEDVKFYLDNKTLGTYKDYMKLHYPEYEHIWKHQL